MKFKKLFTSESVSEGHPDKICDQVSDAILDHILQQDPNARVACEVLVTQNKMIIAGQITTTAKVDYKRVARSVLQNIGYNDRALGMDYKTCEIKVIVNEQSPEIARGVDVRGAGDQGIMFGYATNETRYYMPLAIALAHDLVKLASQLRRDGDFKWARPDMKSEVTVDFSNPNQPRIHTILMSVQHDPNFVEAKFKAYIKEKIANQVATWHKLNTDFTMVINPCGPFTIGGPEGDTGLTGRKIIVDTYGGIAHHGGGCFSGKDPSKVDRTAAYMCRHVAKNIVASKLASKCEIQVAYAIGRPQPISITVDTFGTNKLSETVIQEIIINHFDFSPAGMIKHLDLKRPIFLPTATYGHFGRPEVEVPWEKLDCVKMIEKYLEE